MTARSHDAARLRLWRPIPREAADIICGEGTVNDLPVHAHDALQVILPASRFAIVNGTGIDVVVEPGQLYVAAPLELHGVRSLDGVPCNLRVVIVPLAAVSGSPRCWEGMTPGQRQVLVEDPVLHATLWTLVGKLRGPLIDLSSATRLLECIGRLLAGLSPSPRPPHAPARMPRRCTDAIDRVGAYLRTHVADGISLDELARVAGLSKFYLLRAFRRVYGVTPHAYQRQLRLAHAWRAIAEGRPLTRATYDAGFADQSHLTRQFSALFGVTPARCARQLAMPRAPATHPRSITRSAPSTAA